MNDSLPTERTTECIPAIIAWSATETDVCSDSTFPDDAFCLQLIVLSGEHHIYRLRREALTQLLNGISKLLSKTVAAKEASVAA